MTERYCYFCCKTTETKEEVCVLCGLSKQHERLAVLERLREAAENAHPMEIGYDPEFESCCSPSTMLALVKVCEEASNVWKLCGAEESSLHCMIALGKALEELEKE